MNINDAVALIDDLCGKKGLFSVAWKQIRARLYEEVQKPAHNSAMVEICKTCGYKPCTQSKQFEGTVITHCTNHYKLHQ